MLTVADCIAIILSRVQFLQPRILRKPSSRLLPLSLLPRNTLNAVLLYFPNHHLIAVIHTQHTDIDNAINATAVYVLSVDDQCANGTGVDFQVVMQLEVLEYVYDAILAAADYDVFGAGRGRGGGYAADCQECG